VMDDWWARGRNVLNLIKYMIKKSEKRLQQLYTQLSFLDQLCSGNAKAMDEVGTNAVTKTVIIILRRSSGCSAVTHTVLGGRVRASYNYVCLLQIPSSVCLPENNYDSWLTVDKIIAIVTRNILDCGQ